jgi:hypothetical protein
MMAVACSTVGGAEARRALTRKLGQHGLSEARHSCSGALPCLIDSLTLGPAKPSTATISSPQRGGSYFRETAGRLVESGTWQDRVKVDKTHWPLRLQHGEAERSPLGAEIKIVLTLNMHKATILG